MIVARCIMDLLSLEFGVMGLIPLVDLPYMVSVGKHGIPNEILKLEVILSYKPPAQHVLLFEKVQNIFYKVSCFLSTKEVCI